MRVLLVVAALALGAACSAPLPAVQGWHDTLRVKIHEAKSLGAIECAPQDLAKAQMQYRFATGEIQAGDLGRAVGHLEEGLAAADRATRTGVTCGVRGLVTPDPMRDPLIDEDGDGVVEADDRCAYQLEDFDGFQDTDGCPDPDNDGDGLLDTLDPCPVDAEDLDGFQDQDGCPELDNDGDGVPDDADACPSEPETVNEFEDEDGCPDFSPTMLSVVNDRLVLEKKLDFAPGMNVLLGTSHPTLREVAEVLRLSGDKRLRIEGHTDNRGEPATLLRVSEERAASVRDFLLTQGVPNDRLEALGKGGEDPVSTNRTPIGRAANNRIELLLVAP